MKLMEISFAVQSEPQDGAVGTSIFEHVKHPQVTIVAGENVCFVSTKELVFCLDGDNNKLLISLLSHEGIKREYTFPFEDQDNIPQAEVPRKGLNLIRAPAKVIQDEILEPMATAVTELSFVPTSNSLIARSYYDSDIKKKNDSHHTSCHVSSSRFEKFKIAPDTYGQDITFPMKEIKAMLTFCRDLSFDILLYFSLPGLPLLMSNAEDSKILLQVEVIVSTLGDPESAEAQMREFAEDHDAPPEVDERGVDIDQKVGEQHHEEPLREDRMRAPTRESTPGRRRPATRDLRSPSITPTQSYDWGQNNSRAAPEQSGDQQSEANSKFSFDLYPPGNGSHGQGASGDARGEEKRNEAQPAQPELARSGSDDDDEGSFVAGTPDSELDS